MSVGTEPRIGSEVKGGIKSGAGIWWIVAAWLLVFAIACAVDSPVAIWTHCHTQKYLKNHQVLTHVLRFFGNFWFTIVASLVLLSRAQKLHATGSRRWRDAAIVFVAGVFSVVNEGLKWCFGRLRPFHGENTFELHPFRGLIDVRLMSMPSLSFPSGDATLAFAMVITMSFAAPRWRWLWWFLGITVILERLAEGAHYPSDTVGGAALGVGLAYLARYVVDRWIAASTPKNSLEPGFYNDSATEKD